MTRITQDMKNYIGRFFDDSRVTTAEFSEMSKKYGVPGRDGIIEGICLPLLEESNKGDAVHTFPYKLAKRFGNDYDTVEEIHKKKGLTKYDINDNGFTRVPGSGVTIH